MRNITSISFVNNPYISTNLFIASSRVKPSIPCVLPIVILFFVSAESAHFKNVTFVLSLVFKRGYSILSTVGSNARTYTKNAKLKQHIVFCIELRSFMILNMCH